jgi:parallel beta-helix repeat protein
MRSVLLFALAGCTSADVAAPPPGQASCVSLPTQACLGDDLQAKLTALGPGGTLILEPGVYRLQTIAPLTGQTIQGRPGAVLSGARVLTGWTQSGASWFVGGQTQQGVAGGVCASGTACQLPEDLFVDDALQRRVTSLAAVGPGSWYFDYAADRAYVGSDPTGHVVEIGVRPYAVTGSASAVTIKGLTIEKYATTANHGAAVFGYGSSGWRIEDNEVRWNHSAGIYVSGTATIRHNNAHHNGQLGMVGDHIVAPLIDSNTVANNNTVGFDPNWAAGGIKILTVTDLVLRKNLVSDNAGYGLWCDNCSATTTYYGNTVTGNSHAGIYHEVSAAALIDSNTTTGNGLSTGRGGIWVENSADVEVRRNTVSGNGDGIKLRQVHRPDLPARVLTNVYVHDNTITTGSGSVGLVQFVGDNSYFTSRGNRFDRNRYVLSATGAEAFLWNNGILSRTGWQAAGQDPNGTFAP